MATIIILILSGSRYGMASSFYGYLCFVKRRFFEYAPAAQHFFYIFQPLLHHFDFGPRDFVRVAEPETIL